MALDVPNSPPAPVPLWHRLDEAIGIVCLIITTGSVSWGVITRYLFPQPAAWTYEVATMSFAWLVFFGTAAGVRYRMHADIDIVVATFPAKWQRIVAIANWVLLALLFALMVGLFAWQAVVTHTIYSIALNLPRSLIYGPIAVACLMMLVHHMAFWGSWNDPAVEPAPEART